MKTLKQLLSEIKTENTRRWVDFSILSWFAAFWSYAVNKSILWAVFHYFCGSAYIAYRVVFHSGLLPK